jgi:alkylation response protein AidB-like acyl-CoA dehydrogenase
VELDLTSDQQLLAGSAARFIAAKYPLSAVRHGAESGTAMPADYLGSVASLGWFSMLVPEAHGGGSVSGAGLRDLAIIAEERGRGLQPGPFLSMNVVAAAVARSGAPEQQDTILPAIVAGDCVATWAGGESPAGGWRPGASIAATEVARGWQLSGQAGLVEDGAAADQILVTAAGPEGLTQFLVPAGTPGLSAQPMASLDITRQYALVSFDRAVVGPEAMLGRAGCAADDVEVQLQMALVLAVSDSVGAMDELFQMTLRYASDRTAFGRPIGGFQAIKHQLADLSLGLEAGKAVAVAATRSVQAGGADAGEIASMAKAWVAETGIDLAQGCFQIFGGIGFTWEHDSHLFLRRITMNALLFGQADWHRERICTLHDLPAAALGSETSRNASLREPDLEE